MTTYNITFQYSENVYCSNIAIGTEAQVKKHYANYEIIAITEASDYDLEEAQRKGKPVIDCTGEEITEETTETTEETKQEGKIMTTQKFYYGNPISEYGLENNKVDYATFSKAFNHVFCDFEALSKAADYDFEPVDGSELYYELDGVTYTPDEMEEKKEELEAHLEEVEEMEETPDNLEEIASIEKDLEELQDEKYYDVFQWYIVPENALPILEENNEIVYYSDTLNLYVWGVTHFGTSWDYVLTDIAI